MWGKKVEEEKGRTYMETIIELKKKKKKSIENVNPYRKLLVRGAFNIIVKL